MTTYLFSTAVLTKGADQMAQTDPHGWLLTAIAVSVVFLALIILYGIYSFSGSVFSGKIRFSPPARKKRSGKTADAEIAVAIALALEAETGHEAGTEAAIAMALHLYLSETVHDIEPGFITIHANSSAWNDKKTTFRKLPR